MSLEEEATFDVRLVLKEAVCCEAGRHYLSGTETFERRRLKGCPALRMKAYKNLMGGEGAFAPPHPGLKIMHDP